MTTLYISEFSNLGFASDGVLTSSPGAQFWNTDQVVTITSTSTPSAAFASSTAFVVLSTDSICSIAWTLPGALSVNAATATNLRLPAGAIMVFAVTGGMKVSVISNT